MSVVHVDFLGERAERELAHAKRLRLPTHIQAELRELLDERQRIIAEERRRSEAVQHAALEVAKAVRGLVHKLEGK